jgi:hypothetical protein
MLLLGFRGAQAFYRVKAQLDEYLKQEDIVCFEAMPVEEHVQKRVEACFGRGEYSRRAETGMLLEGTCVIRLIERSL